MKQEARKNCPMSSLIICILHRKWGNKIKKGVMGGTFNMHVEDDTALFVKIFIAFLSPLKELTINKNCFLQIFVRALITVTHFKVYAFRNYKKIYGAESFSTIYGISRLFLPYSLNSATGPLLASETVFIPSYPMLREQFPYNQAIYD